MGMTEQEIRTKILELLANGVYQKKTIKETLWIESDRKLDNVINSLMRDGLIAYTPNKGYTLKKIMQEETPKKKRKIKIENKASVVVIRIIFAILSVLTSLVSIYNTSKYLCTLYPTYIAYMISISMSLFLIASFTSIVLFIQRKQYIVSVLLTALWALTTVYSGSSTIISMYNTYRNSFQVQQSSLNEKLQEETQIESVNTQITLLQQGIVNKQSILDRYNKLISTYSTTELRDANKKDYNNLSWGIASTEKEIVRDTQKIQELLKNRNKQSVSKNIKYTPDFYEQMAIKYKTTPFSILFILLCFLAVFIDIMSPVSASIALLLNKEH